MFDGSTLPLEENLRIASALLDTCLELDVILEIECAVVGGEEDGTAGPANSRDELYTTPVDLLRVAETLGVGERGRYLVAATFGNVHGTYAPGDVVLRPEILHDGQRALAAEHPVALFQYVFHGSSGSQPAGACRRGLVRSREGQRRHRPCVHARGGRARAGPLVRRAQSRRRDGDRHSFEPRAWGGAGEAAMAERVRQACEQLGSAGRTLAASAAGGRARPSLVDLD